MSDLGGVDGDGETRPLVLTLPTCTKLEDPLVLLLLAEAVDEGALAPGVADLLPPLGDLLAPLLASRRALVSGILVLKIN